LSQQCIYVTNAYTGAVEIYRTDEHGVARPIERIKGLATGLASPEVVAVDGNHNVYVANVNGSYKASITVYPAGEYGDVAPTQTISGPDTQMGNPTGIAVDPAGNIYVTNWFPGSACVGTITVYAAGSNGDAAPIAQIAGRKTRLCDPWGTAIDSSGNIYVTGGQQYSSFVNVYAAGSNGNVSPMAEISGKRTLLYGPTAITLDTLGNMYVASSPNGTLVKFRAGAHGNAKPAQAIYGLLTKLQYPEGIALDSTGEIYTIATPQDRILVFAGTANGDVPPLRIIRANDRLNRHGDTDLVIR
jgi:sugar lactone lactonase YvrE